MPPTATLSTNAYYTLKTCTDIFVPQKYKESWEITMNDKMNKVKQMDKVLEMYYLLRFNQQEVETMNRQITSNKIGSII